MITPKLTAVMAVATAFVLAFGFVPAAFAQPTNPNKVTICHNPEVDEDGEVILGTGETITVGAPAAEAHVREHGDYLGACQSENPPPPEEDVFYCLDTIFVGSPHECYESSEQCEARADFLRERQALAEECQEFQTPPPDARLCTFDPSLQPQHICGPFPQ